MTKSFQQSLAKLKNLSTVVTADDIPDAEGTAPVVVKFSDGTILKAHYWRLIQHGRSLLSSFDHQKKYGLTVPINAKEQLSGLLEAKICTSVQFDSETADLTLVFGETSKLHVFNFTGYEIWEIRFPDGTGQYSNYALG